LTFDSFDEILPFAQPDTWQLFFNKLLNLS